jgi:hypothetical protein
MLSKSSPTRRHALEGSRLADQGPNRESKFGRSRLVPVHETTMAALAAYAAVRNTRPRTGEQPSFFVSRTGRRLIYQVVCRRSVASSSHSSARRSTP